MRCCVTQWVDHRQDQEQHAIATQEKMGSCETSQHGQDMWPSHTEPVEQVHTSRQQQSHREVPHVQPVAEYQPNE